MARSPLRAAREWCRTQRFDAIAIAPLVILLTAYDPESACTPALMSWLRQQDRQGSTIGCVDTGALVLARAGVLRGRQVAAHQEVVAPFREEIGELLLDRRHNFDGNLVSSAGGFATMDMVLKLIEKSHSDELARRVAHAMNFEMPSSDRVSENPDYPSGATRIDRRLGRMIALMQANLETPLSVAEIYALALVEESTARRLFQRYFKQSPRAYYMHLRLEWARNLLRYSHLSVAEIAAATGFADSPSFSHSFNRAFGIPPSRARVNDLGTEYGLPVGMDLSKKGA